MGRPRSPCSRHWGWAWRPFTDIEVADDLGRPVLHLCRALPQSALQLGIVQWSVSISHDGNTRSPWWWIGLIRGEVGHCRGRGSTSDSTLVRRRGSHDLAWIARRASMTGMRRACGRWSHPRHWGFVRFRVVGRAPALLTAAWVVPGWWGGGVAAGGVRVMAGLPWWTVRW